MPRRLSTPMELLEAAASQLRRQDSSDDEYNLHSPASTGNLGGGNKRGTNRQGRRASSSMGTSSSKQVVSRMSGLRRKNDLDDSQLSESQNIFPTRNNDLRHVDQSINLMDAEKANYKAPRSDYVFAMQDSSGEDTSDDEDSNPKAIVRRGSFAMIQDGLSALRQGAVPRRGSCSMVEFYKADYDSDDDDDVELSAIPGKKAPKHHSMSFLTDLEDCGDRHQSLAVVVSREKRLDSSESSSSSSSSTDHSWADHLIALRNAKLWRSIFWAFALGILVGSTTLTILYWDHLPIGKAQQDSNVLAEATEAPTLLPPIDEPIGISKAPASINRRKMVLEHVIAKGLMPEPHDPELDLKTPSAHKAVDWMTGQDEFSMKILDAYHYAHGGEFGRDGPIVLGKQYTIAPSAVKQERQILDRYIRVVFYFVAHPNADVTKTEIN